MRVMPKRLNILGSVGDAAQSTPLPARLAITPKLSIHDIEEGEFYEIDHSRLPAGIPAMLRVVRVVLVTCKGKLGVSLRYPSSQSLEACFSNPELVTRRAKVFPQLDEKVDIPARLAVKVLGRQITSEEFVVSKYSKFFWVNNCFKMEQVLSPISVCYADNNAADFQAKNGTLSVRLRCHEPKGKDTKHKKGVYCLEPRSHQETLSESYREVKMTVKEEGNDEMSDKKIIQYTRKRKRGRPSLGQNQKRNHSPKPKPIEQKAIIKVKKEHEYVDRWPVKRYEAAAKDLSEVLKAKGAVHGNPISRFELRALARNTIGDTGLLDHLLKHLAGKVVPGGNERLRRRCDPEGKMEYWLESADLADIRKEAGIQDPYWIPPPGWKPGDCLGTHDCRCDQQVMLLKEELSSMRRHIEELKSKNNHEQAITVVQPGSVASFVRLSSGDLDVTASKEIYEALVKKKSIVEEQLRAISKSLLALEEYMKTLSYQEAASTENPLLLTAPQSLRGEEMNEVSANGIEDFAEAAAGELSESNCEEIVRERQPRRTSLLKLKRCRQPDPKSNLSSQAVSYPADDLIALTPASGSPLSSTTS